MPTITRAEKYPVGNYLTNEQVLAAVKIGGLNPKTEGEACLLQLQARRLIDRSPTGVEVLGLSGETALSHAATLLDGNDPQPIELAAIELAELTSRSPLPSSQAIEYIGDTYKIKIPDATDFIDQSANIGFVDGEGEGASKLLYNGNLFRRDNVAKTKKVIDSLSADEARRVVEFDTTLKTHGSILFSQSETILGGNLLSKLNAAAVYDMNVVSNEAGDHVIVTAPSSFHKFSNPITEDAFDHAKALVSALSYGMQFSSVDRGRIWGIGLLLRKLIRGQTVGPAVAIGHDYRALEFERVVKLFDAGSGYFRMKLIKTEVGEIALEVLQGGNAAASALEALPSAGMRSYTPPEVARTRLRKSQSAMSKNQTLTLLSAVRSGSSL